jgi:hypothetical protein
MVSSYPLRAVLHNPNATVNIAKWAVELAEFELDFTSRHVIKSQVLTDFIVDCTLPASHPGGPDVSEPVPKAPAFTGSTGLFSSMAPRVSRGRCGGTAPHPSGGPIQVYGAPELQSNQ